jgi:hypothetical protein
LAVDYAHCQIVERDAAPVVYKKFDQASIIH